MSAVEDRVADARRMTEVQADAMRAAADHLLGAVEALRAEAAWLERGYVEKVYLARSVATRVFEIRRQCDRALRALGEPQRAGGGTASSC